MPPKIPTDDLVEELQRLSNQINRVPSYTDMAEKGEYSAKVYTTRFGDWETALDESGVNGPREPWQDKSILKELFEEKGMTQSEIADELGCSPMTVNLWIREHELGSGATCPTCGRSDFRNEHGMKIHHERVHDRSLQGEEVECSYCGSTFRKKHGDLRRGDDHHFCDWECRRKWGVEVAKTPIECEWCGDVFRMYRHENPEKRRFCSSDCHTEWQITEQVGENHPNWKGGHIEYYGPNWLEQRRKARNRDGYECQSCGTTEDELGRELDVHHKIPFRAFVPDEGEPDYERANALSNLICLCQSCHQRTEPMAPLCPISD